MYTCVYIYIYIYAHIKLLSYSMLYCYIIRYHVILHCINLYAIINTHYTIINTAPQDRREAAGRGKAGATQRGVIPQLIFIHIHQFFIIQYTLF